MHLMAILFQLKLAKTNAYDNANNTNKLLNTHLGLVSVLALGLEKNKNKSSKCQSHLQQTTCL